jgi:phosphoenolpyruvate-protein phosphotransferase
LSQNDEIAAVHLINCDGYVKIHTNSMFKGKGVVMSFQQVKLFPPLKGVFVDLAKVPDPVFAEKMVGDGFAIDPLDNVLHSPIDGKIKSIHRAKHAITIESNLGFDILIHVGLETVSLGGEGFKVKVKEGDLVKTGDILSEFDIAYISERVVALITPVLVTDIEEKQLSVEILPHDTIIDLSKPIMIVNCGQVTTISHVESSQNSLESELITVPNTHGIHARPAAQLNAIARKYPNHEIVMLKGEQSGNVKSVVSLLSLSVQYQDQIKILVKGDGAQAIIDELKAALLEMHDDESENPNANPTAGEEDSKVENGKYHGVVASTGMAVAKLVQQTGVQFKYDRFAADSEAELAKLETTTKTLITELETEIKALTEFDVAHKNILSAHLMILTDPELTANTKNLIMRGQSAPFAWDKATDESCKALAATGNALLIERQSDLLDVRDRVLTGLCGSENKVIQEYTENVILVAEDYTPSQVIALSDKVKGLVSVRGGVTSHVSILARTRGIPLLVGVAKEVLQENSKIVVLDTLNTAILNSCPNEQELTIANQLVAKREEELRVAQESSSLAATTSDGIQINCLANIGNINEAKIAAGNGAEGVGLFRTEFMFLESKEAPSEEMQFKEYSEINHALGGKGFVIRTLDAGGDKKIPYITQVHEENPMLGVRGVRLCLANRELFKTQLRAILRTKAENIKVMIPMISKLSEYRAVKQIFEELKTELNVTTNIQLGIMVEVPSVAFMSEAFAKEVDFMSIGTNDLTQYVMAVDREHTELAKEVDHLHPAVLAAIAATARGAHKHDTSLSVCGLMASEKLAIPVLIGLGIKNLSMTVSAIPENKAFIRTLNFVKCKEIAYHCLSLPTAIEVREYLKNQFN